MTQQQISKKPSAFKKVLKWTGRILLALVIILATFYAIVYYSVSSRMHKKYSFSEEIIDLPADSASFAAGIHLAKIRGCEDCHGKDLSGKMMMDDPMLGSIAASNLTRGEGGLPGDYSVRDWMRSLRHGIKKNGEPLLIMPSHESTLMSDKDLAALIAYCEQVKPVNNVLPQNKVGPILRVMTFFDKVPLLPVEMINHNAPVVNIAENITPAERGKYLAVSCQGCHRTSMKGGAGFTPDAMAIPDITGSGAVGKWNYQQFYQILKTGTKPDGSKIDPVNMPWTMTAQYNDDELEALYAYLKTLK